MTMVPALNAPRSTGAAEAPSAGTARPLPAGSSGRPAGGSGTAPVGGTFSDALSTLRGMPGIGMVCRALTGEDLSPVVRVLGGLATGGVPGAAASAASVVAGEVLSFVAADTAVDASPSGREGPGGPSGSAAAPTGGGRSAAGAEQPTGGTDRHGPDLDIARRLQEGLTAYEHSRMLADGAVPPAPGALLAQAGRAAA